MSRIKLKIHRTVYGSARKPRFHFRRAGYKRSPLPGLPGSAEFMEAYQAALAGVPRPEIGAGRTIPGTVNAAIVAFYARCNSFRDNKPITQADRPQHTRSVPCETWRQAHRHAGAEAYPAHARGKGGQARGAAQPSPRLARAASLLCHGRNAQRQPGSRHQAKAPQATSGYHSWTEEELRQYEQRHPIGSKPRLALALLLYTAQRRADMVRLGPSNPCATAGCISRSRRPAPK